jgi:hypothetical protein
MSEFVGLSNDEVLELLSKGRTRNMYGPKILEFLASDEVAIDVAEVWPVDFSKKVASTLYQGFINAAKKADLTDQIMVKQSDEHVFILNTEKVALLKTAQGTLDSEPTTEV